MATISIAFVDDHPLFLDGLSKVFLGTSQFDVVAVGTTADDAIDIVDRHRPEILLLDLNLAGNCFNAIAEISSRVGSTKVIIFTAASSVDSAVQALQAGASGYVLKGSTLDEVIEAISEVRSGETFINRGLATKVIAALHALSTTRMAAQSVRLTLREEQILKVLLGGRTNREIAERLTISEKTVKHYMTVLMQKLRARNRLEVVLAAQQLKLLSGRPEAAFAPSSFTRPN